jgi:hypothetical protein
MTHGPRKGQIDVRSRGNPPVKGKYSTAQNKSAYLINF